MAIFGGKARRQALRLLTYAAATGTAALVDVATGESELSVGDPIDAETKWRAARRLRDADDAVLAIDPRRLVGRVGPRFALVVLLDAGVPPSEVCSNRVAKASALLIRMLRPTGEPPGGSGAPAEVSAAPPPKQR